MSIGSVIARVATQEDVFFLLTNRIPRRLVTQFMGWFSQIEQPVIRKASIAVWRSFGELELEDATRTEFKSMHDLFTRRGDVAL